MNVIFLIIGGIGVYVAVSFLFKRFFYKGTLNEQGWHHFNLSPFAEYGLTIFYLGLGIIQLVVLFYEYPVWYKWFFPILWLLFFLLKALIYFSGRRNFIKIKGNTLSYFKSISIKEIEEAVFTFQTYQLYKNKTNYPFKDKGWFLKLYGAEDENKQLELDLADMNLEGFKDAIEKVLTNYGNSGQSHTLSKE
jgi:hypothetical protein